MIGDPVIWTIWNAIPASFSSMLAMILIAILTLLVAYEYWFQSLRYVKLGNQIPGPRTFPIIGNGYLTIGKSPRDIMKRALKIYDEINSDVVRLWFGPRLLVGLANPKDVEIILESHLAKAQEYNLLQPWLGDGLLLSSGEKWKARRKMIAPTFHSSILKSFVPIFNRNANILLENLKKEQGKVFDAHDYMSAITVDTLLETAMGIQKTDKDNTAFQYAMAVMKMCYILHLRHCKIWLYPEITFKFTSMWKEQINLLHIIHNLTRKVIKHKKENYYARKSKGEQSLYNKVITSSTFSEVEGFVEETCSFSNNEDNDVGEKKRLAFLDFMIEASHSKDNTLADEEIKEEVDTIMLEGHDTTAAALSFVLTLLGIHQDVQEKVFEELKEIFQDDFYRPITFNDTVEMKYLERVIMETLRLYPPVPVIGRQVKEDVKLVTGDYTVPTGTTIIIGTYVIHRHPNYYENPEKFDPDNFLPERCQNRPYYAYIPFSAGPRSCVGRKYAMLKLKVILASVLRKYRTISLKKEEDFELQSDIILKMEDGFQIKIKERDV